MEEKGFKVRDKRRIGREPEEVEEKAKEEIEEKVEEKVEETSPLPPIDFSNFILSLSTSAILHFGEIPDPISKKKEKNLTLVKQTIDIIDMLKEKTRGNLKKEEEVLIDNILYDLRMKYVKETT